MFQPGVTSFFVGSVFPSLSSGASKRRPHMQGLGATPRFTRQLPPEAASLLVSANLCSIRTATAGGRSVGNTSNGCSQASISFDPIKARVNSCCLQCGDNNSAELSSALYVSARLSVSGADEGRKRRACATKPLQFYFKLKTFCASNFLTVTLLFFVFRVQ